MEESYRMSVWNWIGSLIVPLLVVPADAINYMMAIDGLNEVSWFWNALNKHDFLYNYILLVMLSLFILVTITPLVVTIVKKVDTSRYLLFRLIVAAIPFVFLSLPFDLEFASFSTLFHVGVVFGVPTLFSIICTFFCAKNRYEWLVIALSDPTARIGFFIWMFVVNF